MPLALIAFAVPALLWLGGQLDDKLEPPPSNGQTLNVTQIAITTIVIGTAVIVARKALKK